MLTAVSEGVLDDVPLDPADSFRVGLAAWLALHCPEAVFAQRIGPSVPVRCSVS